MIVYDLECSMGHVFEGWFDSLQSFEDQNRKKMVRCPNCDDFNIKRVLSPVTVKMSNPDPLPDSPGSIDYQRLAKEVVDYVHKSFEDVGTGFAAEALKIHYGVAEKRNIRGSATSDEEKTLKDEGVEFFKIPLPKTDDDREN